jgi:Fatty acid hydroxylase superfamily
VFANFFEWTVHRFPMHRPLTPRMMYRNHAQIHHGAFTDDSMAMREPRELWLIMMPWYTIVLLLVAASPVAIVAAFLGGLPLAGIFYIGALTYFLFYETVHALYHVEPARLARFGIGPSGLFARMRAHHARHHALRRMAHVNFNVTVPLADIVFGTREKAGAPMPVRRAGGGGDKGGVVASAESGPAVAGTSGRGGRGSI